MGTMKEPDIPRSWSVPLPPLRLAWPGALTTLLLGALLPSAACSDRSSSGSSASGVTYIDSEGGGELAIDGVHFEIDASVHYRYQFTSTDPGTSQRSATVNGHEFGLRDGRVFVGSKDYGPAPSGAHVRIAADGVTVDGEPRGALPEAGPRTSHS